MERFRAKWIPVRVKKTRQNKKLELRFRFYLNRSSSIARGAGQVHGLGAAGFRYAALTLTLRGDLVLHRLRAATRNGVDLFPIPGIERKRAGQITGSIEPPGAALRPGAREPMCTEAMYSRKCARRPCGFAKVRQVTDVPGRWHRVAEIARKRPQNRLKRPISPEMTTFCP